MSKEIGIELATVVDAAHVAAMSRDLIELGLGWSWTPSRVARHIRSSDSVVLVAKDKKRIAAFAIMRFGQEEAHLDLLAVRPKYRRSSMGRRLIAWLEPTIAKRRRFTKDSATVEYDKFPDTIVDGYRPYAWQEIYGARL
jgi:ribosomal protein S18 acetylase RimI-like enzyme